MLKASCLLIFTSDDKMILQKRDNKPNVNFAGLWGPIGGAALDGESEYDCMIRECLEETGWIPKSVQKVFSVREHCIEAVFCTSLENINDLRCYEGECLKAFKFHQLDGLKISQYHRNIINKCIEIYVKG